MKRNQSLITRLIISSLAIFISGWILPGVQIDSFMTTIGIAIVLGLILSHILPHTPMWNKLILSESVGGLKSPGTNLNTNFQNITFGSEGLAVSELFPVGEVEIEGVRYDARSSLGKIAKGTPVEVTGLNDYELIVRKL